LESIALFGENLGEKLSLVKSVLCVFVSSEFFSISLNSHQSISQIEVLTRSGLEPERRKRRRQQLLDFIIREKYRRERNGEISNKKSHPAVGVDELSAE
jgi:hypothetical protein